MLAELFQVDAWKLYPVWGPDGRGYRLDDPATGLAAIRHGHRAGQADLRHPQGPAARGAGSRVRPLRRRGPGGQGVPQGEASSSTTRATSRTTSRGPTTATSASGASTACCARWRSPASATDGNVWAELGGVWREVMKKPIEAAHVMGKLLKHLGRGPHPLGHRRHLVRLAPGPDPGLPRLRDPGRAAGETRLPGADPRRRRRRSSASTRRRSTASIPTRSGRRRRTTPSRTRASEYRNDPSPHFSAYGPRTRAELFGLLRRQGGMP